MFDRINPNTGDASPSDFDPEFSREEAEDWLNAVPLFEPPPEGERDKSYE